MEGREVHAFTDSGCQVNTVMPSYVRQHEFLVLPLHDLFDHPLNLVGLGGTRTHPLGFMILRVWVKEIAGYDEGCGFPCCVSESEFSWHVPIIIGTCTLGRIVNMIKESEMDRLFNPLGYGQSIPLVESPGHCGGGPGHGW